LVIQICGVPPQFIETLHAESEIVGVGMGFIAPVTVRWNLPKL
jgi:hypothetical protein